MQNSITTIWQIVTANQLAVALTDISDVKTMQNFLRDVMTEKEILEISSRLQAAIMLQNGDKYTEIVKKTKLSSTTVARISDWLQNGCGGYQAVLNTTNNRHIHTPPASAV